jgi:hypothetical protein
MIRWRNLRSKCWPSMMSLSLRSYSGYGCLKAKLVVLVGPQTASTAEIVAEGLSGILQELEYWEQVLPVSALWEFGIHSTGVWR